MPDPLDDDWYISLDYPVPAQSRYLPLTQDRKVKLVTLSNLMGPIDPAVLEHLERIRQPSSKYADYIEGDDRPELFVDYGLVLGRGKDDKPVNRLNNAVVSKVHCALNVTVQGHLYITDLGSSHGTTVSSGPFFTSPAARLRTTTPTVPLLITLKPQVPVRLYDCDVITFGKQVATGDEQHEPISLTVRFRYPSFGQPSASGQAIALPAYRIKADLVCGQDLDQVLQIIKTCTAADMLAARLRVSAGELIETSDGDDDDDMPEVYPVRRQERPIEIDDSDDDSLLNVPMSRPTRPSRPVRAVSVYSDGDSPARPQPPSSGKYGVPTSILYQTDDDDVPLPRSSSASPGIPPLSKGRIPPNDIMLIPSDSDAGREDWQAFQDEVVAQRSAAARREASPLDQLNGEEEEEEGAVGTARPYLDEEDELATSVHGSDDGSNERPSGMELGYYPGSEDEDADEAADHEEDKEEAVVLPEGAWIEDERHEEDYYPPSPPAAPVDPFASSDPHDPQAELEPEAGRQDAYHGVWYSYAESEGAHSDGGADYVADGWIDPGVQIQNEDEDADDPDLEPLEHGEIDPREINSSPSGSPEPEVRVQPSSPAYQPASPVESPKMYGFPGHWRDYIRDGEPAEEKAEQKKGKFTSDFGWAEDKAPDAEGGLGRMQGKQRDARASTETEERFPESSDYAPVHVEEEDRQEYLKDEMTELQLRRATLESLKARRLSRAAMTAWTNTRDILRESSFPDSSPRRHYITVPPSEEIDMGEEAEQAAHVQPEHEDDEEDGEESEGGEGNQDQPVSNWIDDEFLDGEDEDVEEDDGMGEVGEEVYYEDEKDDDEGFQDQGVELDQEAEVEVEELEEGEVGEDGHVEADEDEAVAPVEAGITPIEHVKRDNDLETEPAADRDVNVSERNIALSIARSVLAERYDKQEAKPAEEEGEEQWPAHERAPAMPIVQYASEAEEDEEDGDIAADASSDVPAVDQEVQTASMASSSIAEKPVVPASVEPSSLGLTLGQTAGAAGSLGPASVTSPPSSDDAEMAYIANAVARIDAEADADEVSREYLSNDKGKGKEKAPGQGSLKNQNKHKKRRDRKRKDQSEKAAVDRAVVKRMTINDRQARWQNMTSISRFITGVAGPSNTSGTGPSSVSPSALIPEIERSHVVASGSASDSSDGPITPKYRLRPLKRSFDQAGLDEPITILNMSPSGSSTTAVGSDSPPKYNAVVAKPVSPLPAAKRFKAVGSALGLIVLGAALGSVGTIAGLMQLAD